MNCIANDTEEECRQALTPKVRNEIVRDLVSQMFSFDSKPQKEFCAHVAKLLVKKYPFMRDVGLKVSGYVSYCVCVSACENWIMSLLPQGSWEKKIIERVHNVNATLKKRPASDDGDSTPKPKRGRPRQHSMVLTRYPPL